MRRVTLRSLWEHKRRLLSTVVAIFLGVAFMSGTGVFSQTLNRVFDDLFATISENVDARVQGTVLFSTAFEGGDERAALPESLVADVAAVDGVAAAVPYIESIGFGPVNRVLDADGDAVGSNNGPPTLLQSWLDDDEVNPFELTAGSRAPATEDEVVLNVAAADDGEFALGDTVTVATQFGNVEYTLVGTARFGEADSAAGAVNALFTLREAQRLAGVEGTLDSILVRAADDVSQAEVTAAIAPVLPGQAEVITGEEAAEEDAEAVQEGFEFFSVALTIFSAIALLVGTFIIANTFQILVAQRTRELALLRAVGAGRAQVLRSVLLEASVVGTVAAVIGVGLGIALAAAVTAAFSASGADLPSTGLVVSVGTVVQGILVGLLVTIVAALGPAIRATRVPPLAALRDVAVDRSGASRVRLALGLIVLVLGALSLSRAWTADGDTDAIPGVGLGALLLVVGAIFLGPVLAGPSVRVLGSFLPRLRGVTGRLAAENAARSPKRTAATASAIVIGVALIGFITAFASSAKSSVSRVVDTQVDADVIVQPSGGFFGGFGGFSPEVARTIRELPEIDRVSSFAGESGRVTYPDGDTADTFVGAVDPTTYGRLVSPNMEEGDFESLAPGGAIVDKQIADDNDLAIGDRVTFTLPGNAQLDLEIQGISRDPFALSPTWTVTLADFEPVIAERLDVQVFASVVDGADVDTVLASVESAIDRFPNLEVLDRDGFKSDLAEQLQQFVTVIYALLGLSIIIAMIGVANTISLSVHERTRELGLLRAVGMARRQLKSMIRWEAVLIAVLGTMVGLALGIVTSYAMIQALEGFGLSDFQLPVGSLLVQVFIAAALAVVASLLPARRATRLDVLKAIATE